MTQPPHRNRAIFDSKLAGTDKLVLLTIAEHYGENVTCWARPETLAEEAGVEKSTMDRHLQELEERGIIRRFWGDHRSKDIEINWQALAEAPAPPRSKRGGDKRSKKDDSPVEGSETAEIVPNNGTGVPNIGTPVPNIGIDTPKTGTTVPNIGNDTEHGSPGYRTSVRQVPNMGQTGTEHRPRTDQEPIRNRSGNPPDAAGRGGAGPGMLRLPDGREVPLDLARALPGLSRPQLANLRRGVKDTRELLRVPADRTARTSGFTTAVEDEMRARNLAPGILAGADEDPNLCAWQEVVTAVARGKKGEDVAGLLSHHQRPALRDIGGAQAIRNARSDFERDALRKRFLQGCRPQRPGPG